MLNIFTTRRHIMEGTPTISRSKRCMVPHAKVQVPTLFIYLSQTPIFERYEVTCDSKDTLKHISAEIALHSECSADSRSKCQHNCGGAI
jgi:hypothetical protein